MNAQEFLEWVSKAGSRPEPTPEPTPMPPSKKSRKATDRPAKAAVWASPSGMKDIPSDIDAWLEIAKVATEKDHKATWGKSAAEYNLGWKKGRKFYHVWHGKEGTKEGDRDSRSSYCWIDIEGNIYKSATWKMPASGIRGTIYTVDPTKVPSDTAWLYNIKM